MSAFLFGSGLQVATAFSADHTVAIATDKDIRAIVIDSSMMTDDWSVAQSLKMVTKVPILVLCTDQKMWPLLPAGVDSMLLNASQSAIASRISLMLASFRRQQSGRFYLQMPRNGRKRTRYCLYPKSIGAGGRPAVMSMTLLWC
jgi:DNA-binding response OmpR family regulator